MDSSTEVCNSTYLYIAKPGTADVNDRREWGPNTHNMSFGPRYVSPFLYLTKFLWGLGATTNHNRYKTTNDTENGPKLE